MQSAASSEAASAGNRGGGNIDQDVPLATPPSVSTALRSFDCFSGVSFLVGSGVSALTSLSARSLGDGH